MDLRKKVFLGLLSAMAFLLMFLIEFPIPPFPPFLKYDPGDVPALFATLAMGPLAGSIVQLVKAVLFFLSGKSTAGIVGVTANLVTGVSLVLGFGWAYRAMAKARLGIRFGVACLCGAISMTFLMALGNYFIFLPLWGVTQDQLLEFVLTITVPFNLVKAIITTIISWVLYAALISRASVRSFFLREL